MGETRTRVAAWLASLGVVLSVVAGCGARVVPYTATLSMPVDEAIKVIERGFAEQPLDRSFGKIDVTPERVSVAQAQAKANLWTGARGFVETTIAIYFDGVGKWDLAEVRDRYAVRVWYQGDSQIIRLYFVDLERAERFLDALQVLTENAKAGKG